MSITKRRGASQSAHFLKMALLSNKVAFEAKRVGSKVDGLKSGSCRIWQRTDLTPDSNMHGLKSGSCRFWQRTDSPPDSNMLRRAAQTCSACKLAGVQIIPLPTLANQILARTFSDPSCFCVRAQPLESSLGRVPQAADGTCKQIS